MDSSSFCSHTIYQGLTDRVQMKLGAFGRGIQSPVTSSGIIICSVRSERPNSICSFAAVRCDEARKSTLDRTASACPAAPDSIIDRTQRRQPSDDGAGSVDSQIRRTRHFAIKDYRRVPHPLPSRLAHLPVLFRYARRLASASAALRRFGLT